jgi:hypothetical protein
MKNYMIWSKHGKVTENVLQETFDSVIMSDVASQAVTKKQVATKDNVFRNTIVDDTKHDDGIS